MHALNFEDAPHANVTTRREHREGHHLRPKFEDPPRVSVTTRGKQREGHHLRPEFGGRAPRASVTMRREHREGTHRVSGTLQSLWHLRRPAARARLRGHGLGRPHVACQSPGFQQDVLSVKIFGVADQDGTN